MRQTARATRRTQGVGFVGSPAWSPMELQWPSTAAWMPAYRPMLCERGRDRIRTPHVRSCARLWRGREARRLGAGFATTPFTGADEIVLMALNGRRRGAHRRGPPGLAPSWSPDGTSSPFMQVSTVGMPHTP